MARINLGKVVPEKGIDYFTDAEVEEIKNEIKTEIDAQGMAQAITELQLGSGHSVELTLDPQTYQIVLVLKNAAGTALSTQTIDLPNENAITNLAYNNGVLTVTKQSGATSQINLTGLIEGLVTENDFNTFKEALQATLEAINEKDAEQDEAIAENYKVINKLNEKLENQQKVIDQLPQVTGQGTEVTLENTIEAQFTKFDVEGNSVQEINLFDGQLSQGSLDNTGAEVDSAYRIRTTNYIEVVDNNPILINAKSDKEIQYLVYIFDDSKTVYNIKGWYDINTSLTLPINSKYIKVLFKYKDNSEISPSDVTNVVVGKEPAIKSAGDNENLFDITTAINGYIKTNGAVSANNDWKLSQYIEVKNNSSYTMSRSDGTRQSFVIAEYDENKTFIKRNEQGLQPVGVNSPYTITTGASTKYIRINYNNTFQATTIKLEKGNKASGYSPYGMGSINEKIKNADGTEEQDYSIFVQQPFRSIGDVRDCFVKKSDGKLYERHFIGEVIFDGSENWGLAERSETSNGVFYIENFLNTYGIIREQCLSNYGTYVTGYSNKVGQFDIHYSQIRFYAYNNTATINDWKNKLTEKNLVINGFLAEPLDLPCTEEQIQQLENLPSTYKDFTIIQSEDETPAYLEVSGVYDLNKLITRTEVLESEV